MRSKMLVSLVAVVLVAAVYVQGQQHPEAVWEHGPVSV